MIPEFDDNDYAVKVLYVPRRTILGGSNANERNVDAFGNANNNNNVNNTGGVRPVLSLVSNVQFTNSSSAMAGTKDEPLLVKAN